MKLATWCQYCCGTFLWKAFSQEGIKTLSKVLICGYLSLPEYCHLGFWGGYVFIGGYHKQRVMWGRSGSFRWHLTMSFLDHFAVYA